MLRAFQDLQISHLFDTHSHYEDVAVLLLCLSLRHVVQINLLMPGILNVNKLLVIDCGTGFVS